MKYGEAWATSENLEGIAVWYPGRFADMSVWRMVRSGAIGSGMKMGTTVAKKMKSFFTPLQVDRHENMKGRSFTYLQIIGVASRLQGQGFGEKLLRVLLEKSDREGIPVYLETETEINIRWYERYGFEQIKKINLPVINLPMWEMVREPTIEASGSSTSGSDDV
jgi:ribosomal protein S18 acetylase RimI-like enzyme